MKDNIKLFQTRRDHARKRCWERYGFKISNIDFYNIKELIKKRIGKFVSLEDGAETWEVEYNETKIFCVWDPNLRQIKTILSNAMGLKKEFWEIKRMKGDYDVNLRNYEKREKFSRRRKEKKEVMRKEKWK